MNIGRRIILLCMASVAFGAHVAVAHEGHDHIIMGTVTARDDTRVAVKTPSGEVLSIAVTAKTVTVRDKKRIMFKEVQIGRLVVVNIGNGEDPLVAKEIQVGAGGIK